MNSIECVVLAAFLKVSAHLTLQAVKGPSETLEECVAAVASRKEVLASLPAAALPLPLPLYDEMQLLSKGLCQRRSSSSSSKLGQDIGCRRR